MSDNNLPAEQDRASMIKVLGESLYPGAKQESIALVLDYCAMAKLDPMQKPVHIVGMSVKRPNSNQYDWKDVIMPGVGLYRIQADRSGSIAGVSEPEFGPVIHGVFKAKGGGKVEIDYPEWCKVIVKKFVNGQICEWPATERWLENYASPKDATAPNAMWSKRPYAQLAKCAEAQALRKAFPEIGQAPTAEEMEGKEIIDITDSAKVINPDESGRKPPADPDGMKATQVTIDSFKNQIKNGKDAKGLIERAKAKGVIFTKEQTDELTEIQPETR